MPRRRSITRTAALGSVALSMLLVGLPTTTALAAPPTTPFLSEVHYDDEGTDTGEFVEVHLPAGTSSAGLSVVLYNGNNGGVYDTDPVPLVTAAAGAPAVAVVSNPSNGLQNGAPDGIALVDGDGAVLEFLSYEGSLTATDGPAVGSTSTDIGVSETGTEPEGQSLSRGYDTAEDALVWQGPAAATPGTVNPVPTPEPEPDPVCDVTPTHQIGQVQGAGAATPLDGQEVTVEGTVVGAVPGLSGFYLQDADGDGSTATSDGVFVVSTVEPDLGDTVAVTGTAGESFGQTQIDAGRAAEVCADGTAADLPDAAPLDLPAADAARERLEGMLVDPVDALTVSEVYDLTRFGELTLSEGGLLVQPTERARPGAQADALAAEDLLRRIVLDDASSAPVTPSTAPYLSRATPVRVGDVLSFEEPLVLGYGFGQWRLQPADGTEQGVFAGQNTRPAAPDAVGGDVQIGAFNVLNYFLTHTGSDARGARTTAAFERQADKIVPAIEALGAEVVTLMEIEDTDSTGRNPGNADAAVADLVSRLNASAGATAWDFVPLPDELYAVDRDVIRNAIIYQPATVQPVGEPVGLVDETVWSNAREPIAQTFVAAGDTFTVVANHFKSKSPGSPTGDNVDAGDGQGAWNGDRTRQAASLADFADDLRTATGDEDVLLLGDINAYTQEDPIEVLRDAGFVDLGETLDAGRYSYVFDDRSGSLDHALASEALASKVTDLAHWNINAVESFAYQYTGDADLYAADPYRSSDHDPLVVGLDLAAAVVPGLPVQLLGINDFHGRIAETTGGDGTLVTGPGPDGQYGTTDDVVTPVGGAANVATVLAARRRAFVDAGGTMAATRSFGNGDLIGASPFASSVFKDEPTIEVMNALDLEVSSVGNHEFDRGTQELRRVSAATDGQYTDDVTACEGVTPEVDGCYTDSTGSPFAGAEFPYLAANVVSKTTGQPMLPPFQVFEVGGGKRVALIGVVTDTTPTIVSPGGIADVTFIDEATAINNWVPVLQAAGIQAIGVLVHEGGDAENRDINGCDVTGPIADINANVVSAVDVLISGHSHSAFICRLADQSGAPRLVTQAGSYGQLVTDIRLTLDPVTGDVDRAATYTATNVPVTREAPDADVQAIVDYWQDRSAEAGNAVVGSATADILRAGPKGAPVRDAESSLGNLVAQMQLEALQEDQFGNPVIAFMNPGGLRTDILAGEVTYSELFNVQPFGNTVNAITLTGEQIRQVLEQQFPSDARPSQLFLGTSEGFAYNYDPARPVGDRVDPLSITLDGVVLDPAASYRVAANSFLVGGGDAFSAFTSGTDPVTGPVDVDTAVRYFELNSPVSPPTADHATLTTERLTAAPDTGGGDTGGGDTSGGDTSDGDTSGGTGDDRTGTGAGGTGGGGTGVDSDSGGSLPRTGAALAGLLALGAGLLAAGGLATAAGSRRRRDGHGLTALGLLEPSAASSAARQR